ncbi:MAG: DNA-3-methyladenine glycosylase 2 family protein [Solirubrobacterales bacterium]|nr:DNA-3-methyladenine glycosylase 2 family protein [Solirubrobacterales bacterium]
MFRTDETCLPSFERCRQAAEDKDARFDGWFYTGVTSTGIYCRPSCPARTPKAANMRFFATAAAAQSAGFRACKRCWPNASPGSPEWDLRADAVGRAMRLIADGVVDREGVAGLASQLGFSERHVHRMLTEVVGAGPLGIARAARAQNARVLLETTDLSSADVAFASGFSSVRQFNATMQEIFATTPGELRRKPRHATRLAGRGGLELRLVARKPFDFSLLHAYLAHRAVAGVESADDETCSRSMRLPRGSGVVRLRAGENCICARFELDDLRDLGAATERVRRLGDLDADPIAADAALSEDPLLRASVASRPGLRVPGSVDGDEIAIRAVLGQQVSVRGASTAAARLAELCGDELKRPVGGVTHLFPTAAAVAALDPSSFAMPKSRSRALIGLASELASGELRLDGSQERQSVHERLVALPGIGDWTAQYIAMRALRDPDAFLPTDLGVRRGLEALGLDGSPRGAARTAERWRPYRAYALQHLWALASDKIQTEDHR